MVVQVIPSTCRATVGQVSGGGRTEKPMLKAGRAYHKYRVKRNSWPKVCPVAAHCGSPSASICSLIVSSCQILLCRVLTVLVNWKAMAQTPASKIAPQQEWCIVFLASLQRLPSAATLAPLHIYTGIVKGLLQSVAEGASLNLTSECHPVSKEMPHFSIGIMKQPCVCHADVVCVRAGSWCGYEPCRASSWWW